MFRLTPIVRSLLFINIAVFIIDNVFGAGALALRYPASSEFEPWQIATHFFMHANVPHLFFNMFALVMFGAVMETAWGHKKFLFYYLVCAIGAAALHTLYTHWNISNLENAINVFFNNPTYDNYMEFFKKVPLKSLLEEYRNEVHRVGGALVSGTDGPVVQSGLELMYSYLQFQMNIPVVGASGAIFGLLLAFGLYNPEAELMLIFLPIPIKAKYFIPFMMMVELFLGVKQFSWDNIAHFAHLGGALSGLLLILFWWRRGR